MTTTGTGHPLDGALGLAPGTRLLGEILTWTCNGVAFEHSDLVSASKDAGLDEGVARELAPRHAFTRACQHIFQLVAREFAVIREAFDIIVNVAIDFVSNAFF